MLALPLPILTFVLSAVACALVWRLDLGNRLARSMFTAVFALIAIGTLLIGLRFGYGFEQFIVIQRVIPLFIGPMIFLGFSALMRSAGAVWRLARYHLGVAAVAALLPQIIPELRAGLDLVIGLSYLYYGFVLLLLWRQGADSIVSAPLGMTDGLRRWMLCAAGMLGIMLVFDTGIAISFALERFDDAVRLISLGSFFSMVSLIIVIFFFSRGTKRTTIVANANTTVDDASVELEQSARDLMAQKELYLDTNLTLERLAKRLHVPARALSEAINRTQKMNVSQYVNSFRLKHAEGLLEASKLNVHEVLEQSGFLTRSNFYREFEKAHSQSPIEYRKQKLRKTSGRS